MADYYAEHYGQLVGKKVVQIGTDGGENFGKGAEAYCLIFEDGTRAWIMRDPEGNGPGHLNIEEQERLSLYELYDPGTEQVEAVQAMTEEEAIRRNEALVELGESHRWIFHSEESEEA